MMTLFTEDDIIRYIYDEASEQEKKVINERIASDESFRSFYLKLLDMQASINEIIYKPSKRVINNILTYSKTFCTPC